MPELKMISFKSKPKETFFAPEYQYYIFETALKTINIKNLVSLIKGKKKDIMKLTPTEYVGNTGLSKNSTTARYKSYNIFKWKDKNINSLKKAIIKVHNKILEILDQPPAKELYGQCWVNIMKKGEYIKPHLHNASSTTYLGGHFCLQSKDTSTHYINPIRQINNPEVYSSKNKLGKLTLFQNNIPHYTDKTKSERITLAFDLSIKNDINNFERLI